MRAVTAAMLVLLAAPALAATASDGPTFGRLVLDVPVTAHVSVKQHAAQVEVQLSTATPIGAPEPLPRNLMSLVSSVRGAATLTLAPGSHVKWNKRGEVLVLTFLDPPGKPRAEQARAEPPSPVRPQPSNAAPVASEPSPPGLPPPPSADAAPPLRSAAAEPPVAPPSPEPTPPLEPAPVTREQLAAPAPDQSPPSRPAPPPLRLTAGPDVGAAAYRRGDLGIVVFDDDVSPVTTDPNNPGSATLQHQGRATILTVPLAADESLALDRDPTAWTVRIGPAAGSPVVETTVPDGIAFTFDRPGRALTAQDPVTKQLLLVGTARTSGSGHALVAVGRSAPGYVLLPTFLGLVLDLTSDTMDLRASSTGFTLDVPDRAAPNRLADAIHDNQFGIPNASETVLVEQWRAQMAEAAATPPRTRGPARVATAKTMLALGMAAEAQALLTLAANDDPAIASDTGVAALSGIAAVLAGRPAEAAGLDNPALPANGETSLWQGLRDAALGKPAPELANAWSLIAGYPPAIQHLIVEPVMEAAVLAGDPIPAGSLEDPSLAYARALQTQKSGDTAAALAGFDALADGRDERESVRAAVAAAELRLANKQIAAAAAADQIERQTIRWRGDAQELALRLRAAELRTQAGQWRAALDSLHETETVFPNAKSRIAALKTGVFTALLAAGDAAVSPLDLVTMAREFADCFPSGADGERLAGLLADKLVALDLPSRAIPVLQGLVDNAASPAARTELALRLAQMQLDTGDLAKAQAALDTLDAGSLTTERANRRAILLARVAAGRGDFAGAAGLLTHVDTPEAAEMRASLLAKAGDWRGSLGALEAVVAQTLPEAGALTPAQQDLVLREATAAVHAGDADALRRLKRFDSRMAAPRIDLFRVLTATAVESSDDLPRSGRELAMTRLLPERVDALKLP